ncbi:hypothetical protein [Streptomyces sp. NPDC048603]|uniref:hypothetical protein n=1 Tax=Streptomyces sp. NPDC048603 TaxID=3365577 RepID=UPI00371C89C5
MATVAVTGHVRISAGSLAPIRQAVDSVLARYPADALVGLSCLAEGADALFAAAVLAAGGRLEVVLPSADYRARMVAPHYAGEFDLLCGAASAVKVMPYRQASTAAYAAANRVLLARAQLLVAVWDGLPGGRGGTADTVAAARTAGLPVEIVWPPGASRPEPPGRRTPGRRAPEAARPRRFSPPAGRARP